MKPRTLWIALLLAPSVAMLSLPAAALTTNLYDLSPGCTAGVNGSFKNNSLVAGASATYTPGTCGGYSGADAALTSLRGISDTGKSGSGATAASNFALQTAYIGVYGTHLGVTSTAGQTIAGDSALDGTTGILATGTTANTSNGITSETTAAPSHAMDNQYNKEAVLLTFNTAVSLTDVKLGYYNTDSDITVYAYTGTGCSGACAAASALYGGSENWGNLTSNGWAKINDYADAGGAPNSGTDVTPSISKPISTTTQSSWWLIAAYTGSASGTGAGTLSAGNDFVKLLTVTACTGVAGCSNGGQQVPEPSTMLLMGAALLGLSQLRRRRTA